VSDNLLIFGAPESSPDMFHAVPTGIIDPFLYVESDGRRAATISVLDAHKVEPMGIEILDPYDLGADEDRRPARVRPPGGRHGYSCRVLHRECP
jgi:hypothetical protein